MCGASADAKRKPPEKETRYLDELVRGVYARRALPAGHVLTSEDVYFAVPLLHGQISVREFVGGERLRRAIAPDAAVHLREIDSAYSNSLVMQRLIEDRGVPAFPETTETPLRRAASH
jgi:N-acetylneuraminate synthase